MGHRFNIHHIILMAHLIPLKSPAKLGKVPQKRPMRIVEPYNFLTFEFGLMFNRGIKDLDVFDLD